MVTARSPEASRCTRGVNEGVSAKEVTWPRVTPPRVMTRDVSTGSSDVLKTTLKSAPTNAVETLPLAADHPDRDSWLPGDLR